MNEHSVCVDVIEHNEKTRSRNVFLIKQRYLTHMLLPHSLGEGNDYCES